MYLYFTSAIALLGLKLTCHLEIVINYVRYLYKCIVEISLLYNKYFLVLGFFFPSVYFSFFLC
jgi:hypothetical protein